MEVLLDYLFPFATEEREEMEKLKVTHIYYPTDNENPIREFTKKELEGKIANIMVSDRKN